MRQDVKTLHTCVTIRDVEHPKDPGRSIRMAVELTKEQINAIAERIESSFPGYKCTGFTGYFMAEYIDLDKDGNRDGST